MKPVGTACNIACEYCYNRDLRGSKLPASSVMSDSVLRKSIEGFMEAGAGKCRFIWHGGEPLLAGRDFYLRAINLQRTISEEYDAPAVENLIQTNGTLLDVHWLDFLSANDFKTGLSLDGPPEINDSCRRNLGSLGTYEEVLRGLVGLQECDSKFSVGAVVTQASVNKGTEVYSHFRSLGLSNFDFSPCAEPTAAGGLEPYSINAVEFGNFLIEVFDAWVAENDPAVRVRILENSVWVVGGLKTKLCSFKRDCGNFLAVDPLGDVYICGRFMAHPEMMIGNLTEVPLVDLLDSGKHLDLRQELGKLSPECRECKWINGCRGGCPYHSYSFSGSVTSTNFFCESRKMLFEHISNVLTPGVGTK